LVKRENAKTSYSGTNPPTCLLGRWRIAQAADGGRKEVFCETRGTGETSIIREQGGNLSIWGEEAAQKGSEKEGLRGRRSACRRGLLISGISPDLKNRAKRSQELLIEIHNKEGGKNI